MEHSLILPTHALSIQQPWASAIVHGPKRLENRTWMPVIQLRTGPFPIWIHASKAIQDIERWEHAGLDQFAADHPELGWWETDARWKTAPTSVILGAVVVDRVIGEHDPVPPDQQVWWAGPLAWVLRDVVALSEPVRASGRLSLWRPTPEVQAACVERLPAGWSGR